MGKVGLTSVY